MLLHSVDVLNSKVTEVMELYSETRDLLLDATAFDGLYRLDDLTTRLYVNPVMDKVKYHHELEFIESRLENITNSLMQISDPVRMFSDDSQFGDLLHMQIKSLGDLSTMIDEGNSEDLYPEIEVIPDRVVSNCEYIKTKTEYLANQVEAITDKQLHEPLDDLKFAARSLSRRLADEPNTVDSDTAIYTLELIMQHITENMIDVLNDDCRNAYIDISDELNSKLDFVIETAQDVKRQLAQLDK